jgi:hypothetical protein
VDELYVMARRVLLDALEALGPHRDALVLVGAQAVYLRVGEAEFAVAPFTTDGDLAIDPAVLADIPPIEQALLSAGFHPASKDSVGIWVTTRQTSQQVETHVAVDLLVPAAASPSKNRRAARLPGHDTRVARIVRGLDGAMVDADVMRLEALDASDRRALDIRVAGPAALLVAKVHKIRDRTSTNRLSDKDALDVLRLLVGTSTDDLAARYELLLADKRSEEAAHAGRELLKEQFAQRTGVGVEMAVRSAGALGDPDEIAASCQTLASDLLLALE